MSAPKTKYNTKAAAKYLGVAAGTLAAGRTAADPAKQLPIPFEKDGHHVWYRREDLDAYLATKAEDAAATEEEDHVIHELKERINRAETELRKACAERGAACDEVRSARQEATQWRTLTERLVGALVRTHVVVEDALDAATRVK